MAHVIHKTSHLSYGLGKVSAFQIDTKKDHTFKNPEEVAANKSGKIAKWGDDNLYPKNYLDVLRKNDAGAASNAFNRAAHYGQGFKLYRADITDDGKQQKRMVPLASLPEIDEFSNLTKLNRFWNETITDLETFNIAFPEFILSQDFNKITSVRRLNTPKVRFELINPKTGLVENVYFCHNWQTNTKADSEFVSKIMAVDSYFHADQIKEHCKQKKQYKFVMPIFYPLFDEVYYPDPLHHSSYKNGWMEVVNNIPEYKKMYAENKLNISYMVYISEEYFTRTYGTDWDKFDIEKKQQIRKQLADSIDDHLAGKKNAGKSIQATVFKDREGKWVKGIEVEPLKTPDADGSKEFLEVGTGNQQIMTSNLTDPNLMGTGIPGNKLGGEGGSNKREAFSILNSLLKSKRETTLEIWRIIRDYNGWDKTLEGDFAITNLTTLDKNPTGTQDEI